ncbi:MAG TPA: pitrilysin family protein [Longimicrobiales bacterium]|nr:pitrilysin family protein [Longimicrobiales bacterium]
MKTPMPRSLLAAAALTLFAAACGGPSAGSTEDVTLAYQRFVLDNGLEVILHEDHSDPLAAVAMTFHVGSAKEVEGRTGFAHLFEHLFFLDSENLGAGGLDRLMTRVGSSTNGSTSRDRTNYFEVVPVDGLEKALWAEADKLGFFINTVTESVVAKEKQVVKNEKRQGVDNQPYGHNSFVIDEALYPRGHPYRWQVIGSLEDLEAATLEDARDFHRKWYGPNNATLVIAGNIDPEQTRAWVEKYFGEIPSRELPEVAPAPPVVLEAPVRLFHEDNFARLPQLTLAWPTVPRFHPDAYALDVLADLLTDGKNTPLYQVVVEEAEVAPDVSAFNSAQELAGRFTLTVRSYAGVDLDRALTAVEDGLARFAARGVDSLELARVKAGTETRFYGGLASVMGKAFQLADYAIFAGDPGFFREDLERTLAVNADDVVRVFRAYVADRPYVASSFVPLGAGELALEGSERARVVEEPIVQGAEEAFQVVRGEERTPGGAFDRSVEPPFGEAPTLRAPEVWRAEMANGLPVLGIQDREIPLVQFELAFRGGLLLEDPAKVGVAQLLAASMTEGTSNRTPEELEAAIDLLGASIDVRAGREDFTVSGSTLARNFRETLALVEEILLEPRYDPDEFALAKQRTLNQLRQRSASPNAVAQDVFAGLVYGDHILARNPLGDPGSVEAIEIQDLRDFHDRTLVPSLASFHVVGAVDRGTVTEALASLAERWAEGEAPAFPAPPTWDASRSGLYFVDVPNASQSVLNIGYLGPAETDPGFYPATVMNFRFGGGGFASDLTQELREGKGYTYGIRSGFQGGAMPGPFAISSGVRSNITLEALALVKEIMEGFGPGYDETDLEATRSYLLRANARAFETLGAKLGVLRAMSAYGFPADYVLQREAVVREMTIPEVQRLSAEYLDPATMAWLVVGDARTQLSRLEALGLGPVTVLDREGNPAGR